MVILQFESELCHDVLIDMIYHHCRSNIFVLLNGISFKKSRAETITGRR